MRVAVRGVDDEDVDLRVDERGSALERVRPDAHRRADPQPALVVLRRVRVLDPLRDVLDRDEPLEPPVAVDDGELLDLVAMEDRLRLLERRADGRRDQVLLVISAETGCEVSVSKRRSRFVRMPTRTPSSSVIGTPEMR